jgi:serine protease Do
MDRTNRPSRWIATTVLASTVVGLAAPALLHAQQSPARAGAPVQPLPAAPNPATPPPQVASTPAPPPTSAAADAMQLGQAFTDVAQRTLPSVVSIHVESDADQSEMGFPGMGGMPFPFMGPEGRGGRAPLVRGEGSGVVVREDGVILTNNHVVERAHRIMVRMRDGREFRGRVLGTDPAVDIAVVKIDAHALPVMRLGDSDQARVGEWVLAIGAPLGLEATVTHGVVSATGRAGLGANEIEDYLQTDASINPGNSGGPLVNLRGEVLGINTMIVGRNTGIGMAVPSRIAQSALEQILRTGHVSRGWVGVGVQDLTAELSHSMGLTNAHGALVNNVDVGTPAAQAGVAVGDVVTAMDGRPIDSSHDLVRMITRHGVGDRLALSVLRDGHPRTITLTTGARPGAEASNSAAPQDDQGGQGGQRGAQGMGLRLAVLTPDMAQRMNAPGSGVVIAGVEPGSPAEEAGLRRGDLILRADGRAVRNTGDVQSAAQDHRMTLLVRRGNAQVFVPVESD